MKGIPVYTRHSVAFPQNPLGERVLDEIGVSFEAKGGGTHGEFTFQWIELGRQYPHGALRLGAFTDGWPAMLEPRLLGLIQRVAKRQNSRRDISPGQFALMLEIAGVRRSSHHLRGLLQQDGLTNNEREVIGRELEARARHESG